jgi:hypothetical protein
MTFDLQGILESKRALRRNLARRPVAEKFLMLEALRDRARTIRAAAKRKQLAILAECSGGAKRA